MSVTTLTQDISRFCSLCARQAGLDSIGQAYSYTHVLAVEIPLPWPASMYREPGALPQELLDMYKLLAESYQQGEPLRIGALGIAPDPAYSQAGWRRVISYRRPDEPFATFHQEEYLVPEAQTGPLCWALLIDRDAVPRFAAYRQPASTTRDLMICTHGTIDAACAKFGFPIYRHLRRLADSSGDQLRVWRVSHFGGHVFAPTLIDMPSFHYWGYVEGNVADALAQRTGDVALLRTCYRGWAGLDNPLLQVAERELLLRHGWEWTTYRKAGRILEQADVVAPADPDAPTWAEVRIDYATDDGEHGAYTARVELTGHVECVYSSSEPETYPYPQYAVTRLERAV